MKKWYPFMIALLIVFFFGSAGNVKQAQASSKEDLLKQIQSRTSETIDQVYYADYDQDGSKEAFVITKKSDEVQTLWFTGDRETKKLGTDATLYVEERAGICRVSAKQKLFVAEGTMGGSGSWSFCYYVKDGKAVQVKKAGEGLKQISGTDFAVYPGAFDSMYDGRERYLMGHTWKAYYLKWTGTKFVEYKGTAISRKKLETYRGAARYLKRAERLGYRIGKIYYRKNGIINVNVSMKDEKTGDINYNNFTLNVKNKKVTLRIWDKNGKNFLEKSGYYGIYKAKGFK